MTVSQERLRQIEVFLTHTDFRAARLEPLAGDASFRRYIRLHHGERTAMLMDAPVDKEDVRPYLSIAEHLVRQGFSAPAILACDEGKGLLLLEDLGNASYTSLLRGGDAEREHELYAAAIDVLAAWHDPAALFARPDSLKLPIYDMPLLMREVQLFADWYLPQVVGKVQAASMRSDYLGLWEEILSKALLSTKVWVHRDYHADNLMWLPARTSLRRVGLLDFQDGVYGDPAYDLVSLLEDARRDVPPDLADEMLARYLKATGKNDEAFRAAYAVLGAQRNSKIVGIFTRLAARDAKPHYLAYLPRVWGHLATDVTHPVLAPLKVWLDRYVPAEFRGVITLRHTSADLALSA